MNDRQLEAFVTTARLGSMSRAAEYLYVSHPALKKQLDRLEGELGCRLLARTSEGCRLTTAGRELLPQAQELLGSMQAFVAKARGLERTAVRLCCLPDMSLGEQDSAVLAFTRANPQVRVVRVPLPTAEWLEAVASGEADVCSCFSDGRGFEHPGLEFVQVEGARPVCCFVSSSSPLAGLGRLTAADLRGRRVFVGSLLWHHAGWRAFAARNGLASTPLDEAGKRYDLIELCEQGWVCVHPAAFARALEPLVAVPLEGYEVTPGYAYRNGSSAVVRAFAQHCVKTPAEGWATA